MKSSVSVSLLLAWSIASWVHAAARPPQPSTPPSFDELIRTIRTGNAYQRAQAVFPLSWIEDPRVVPELVALLHDEDANVRTYSCQQLTRLADRRSVEALAEALRDPEGNVRRYAAEGLARIGDQRHVPALVAPVMDHLPEANTQPYEIFPSSAALAAIANLSSQAPPELVALMARASDDGTVLTETWWRLLADVAGCLGQIGDKAAQGTLLQAWRALETDHQDYRTWYAVRKALAVVDPQNMTFDNPAADILDSQRPFKGNDEDIRRRWVVPLAQLGSEAIDDLSWALEFENEWDRGRVNVALEALGDIGGGDAAGVLRRYVQQQARVPERERREKRSPIRKTLLALLIADPNEATVREVILACQLLDSFEQRYLVDDISHVSPEGISQGTKMAFYKDALLGSAGTKPLGQYGATAAAHWLGQMGGPQAGEILATALRSAPVPEGREAAARALATIKDYDALPALVEAATLTRSPKGAIVWAMGMIADPRAVPALKDIAGTFRFSESDRLWVAAALARLGVDYADNAGRVRQALPDALEQAQWLHDDESIRAIAGFVHAGEYTTERAVRTLEAISTAGALNALTGQIDLETITDPLRLERLSGAAARMADKLGHPSAEYWAGVTATVRAVRGWFIISQMARPSQARRSSSDTVVPHAGLARRVWIAEVNRRLDLAASAGTVSPEHTIPSEALSRIETVYGPELAQTLERIARESIAAVDFHGKNSIVRHYHVRSLAARILTEKTGQVCTFMDADGRTHPGGWHPSQEDSR